ncbi:hypothetical protein [Shewanella baltica]|uniref:hypothetical protein n=1 Tax=Shewanella baltica TaxID=62322 RepID=UPI000E026198|nr:hypothetical protein [Shewanella baltica]SUI50237.1 Uncharacterised protein [Shewanella baltica]
MYGIPENFDLSIILGSDLNMISQGRYDVQFSFDAGATICLQGMASVLQRGTEIAVWSEENNWSSLGFQKLFNQSVESVLLPNTRLIEIHFKNDLVLQLHDSSEQYESMQIYYPNDSLPSVII